MKRKFLLLLIVCLSLIGVSWLLPASVLAEHESGKRWLFHWVNGQTIQMQDTVDSISYTYSFDQKETDNYTNDVVFTGEYDASEPGCDKDQVFIYINTSDYNSTVESGSTRIDRGLLSPRNCLVSEALHNELRTGNKVIGVTDSTDTENFSVANGSGDEDEAEPSCESEGGVLSWLLCGLIRMIDGALNWVDTQVQSLLDIDQNTYDNDEIKAAWASIRNIAYIILIPIMLVMVIGTALGFEFISAYTVKKALPRLLIAAIFITLSYEITTFLIQLFNVVGYGVLGLMTAPFGNEVTNLTLSSLFGPSIFGGLAVLPAFAAAIIIIWLFGSVLLLFIGTAFLILLLRQMFIVALLLVAPVAILAWIFPGNDKLWKSWWGIFSKLLIMFPLIMGIIAMGKIFAFIIHSGDAAGLDGAILKPLLTLAAYALPYAFIPFTFKFAGGVFGTVAGFAQDKEKGIFDRARQGRTAKLEQTRNRKALKNAPEGSFRSRINTFGAGAMNIRKAGLNPRNWRPNMTTALQANEASEIEKNLKENTDYMPWAKNDTLNKFASESGNREELRDSLVRENNRRIQANEAPLYSTQSEMDEDIARVERVRRSMSNNAFRQMTTMQALSGGTAYETPAEVWEAVAKASGNDSTAAARFVAQGRSALIQAGRVDQGGAGFGDTMGVVRQFQNELKSTGTISQETRNQANKTILNGVVESQGPGTLMHASMKPTAIKNLAPVLVSRLDDAISSNNERAIAQEAASLAGTLDAMSHTSPQLAKIAADNIMDHGIVSNGGKDTVRQLIDTYRSDSNFNQMRREYENQATKQAATRAAESASAQPGQRPGDINPGPPSGLGG